MVRGKTEMRRIENATSRQVTFSKRRSGLLKKAFELSVLCDAEIGLIIFSSRGKLSEFSSSSMQKTIERYELLARDINSNSTPTEQNIQQLKQEAASITKTIEVLELSRNKYLGQCLESCSIDELHKLESQLERSIINIRGRKNSLLTEQIALLKGREQVLTEENAALQQQWKESLSHLRALKEAASRDDDVSRHKDVETGLYIGWPQREVN